MQCRQVRKAEQVCAVTDGADWCQAFTQRHRPDALRILDFPHAAEHVSKLLEALMEVGLHFPDKMLALRTTVCNDRWREMWGRALTSHRKQQALHRSARATSRAQAFLAGGEASSQASPPPSAAIAEQVSPPAPSQLVVEADASALPPPPVPEASQPSPCRLSRRRTRQTARQRVNCSRHSSSNVNADVCLCGTPLVRFKGHRPKQYCSDRCRQRAHRERHQQVS